MIRNKLLNLPQRYASSLYKWGGAALPLRVAGSIREAGIHITHIKCIKNHLQGGTYKPLMVVILRKGSTGRFEEEEGVFTFTF